MDKWVPHELNENHKHKHFEISYALLLDNQNDRFLYEIVTCDKKWILYNNHKYSAQWLDADKIPQHFPKLKLNQKKVMVTVWWSSAGLIHHIFIKPGLNDHSSEAAHVKTRSFRPSTIFTWSITCRFSLFETSRWHPAREMLQKSKRC